MGKLKRQGNRKAKESRPWVLNFIQGVLKVNQLREYINTKFKGRDTGGEKWIK